MLLVSSARMALQSAEREVEGLFPGRTTNQGPEIIGKIMVADLEPCSVQMIASLGSDIKR